MLLYIYQNIHIFNKKLEMRFIRPFIVPALLMLLLITQVYIIIFSDFSFIYSSLDYILFFLIITLIGFIYIDKEIKKDKLKPYIVPALIIVIGIFVVSFLFHKDTQTPIVLSVIGAFFGAFQLALNIQVQTVRNQTSLRHSEYKEFLKLLNSISEIMTKAMMDKKLDIHNLSATLMIKYTEYNSFIQSNDTYLFKNINYNPVLTSSLRDLGKLLERTDKYRYDLDQIMKKEISADVDQLGHDIENIFLKMNWHNEVREVLKGYSKLKYEAIRELQKYIE